MNRLASSLLSTVLALPLTAKATPDQAKNQQALIMVSRIDPKLKVLPVERWTTALLPPMPGYPGLSKIAGIEGELLMHCKVDSRGKVTDTRLVSGPPQLASTLDKWVRQIQFKVLAEDGEGPWHFPISAKFSMPDRIQFFPSAIKLTPAPADAVTPRI